jgi:hypothetical protein
VLFPHKSLTPSNVPSIVLSQIFINNLNSVERHRSHVPILKIHELALQDVQIYPYLH